MASPTVGKDGEIYITSTDKVLYALDRDGILQWSISTDSNMSAAAVGDDNILYVGGSYAPESRKIYAITSEGHIKWTLPYGGTDGSSPALTPDGTLYIGSQDRNLYAVNTNSPGLATDSPWPMHHHNLRRTSSVQLSNGSPTADAGENLETSTEDIATTIINGSAFDPEGDALDYRWLEGETVLLDWTPVGPDGECPLDLARMAFSPGSHVLTLQVSDWTSTACEPSMDDMILTIENSAPHAAPSGAGTYEINTPVILSGQASDFDGDALSYFWLEGSVILCSAVVDTVPGGVAVNLSEPCVVDYFGLGAHTITLRVDD